jgi:hypothetical protein
MLKKRDLAELIQKDEEISIEQRIAEEPAVKHKEEKIVKRSETHWATKFAEAIIEMPSDIAAKIVQCIPRDVIIEALKSRANDPLIRLALILLEK